MILRRKIYCMAVILLSPCVLLAQSDDLLSRILAGIHQSQARFATACGTMKETRTSKLLVRPLVLHGKFCAEGTNRFMLEYFEPNPMRIRLNDNDLNITTGGKTEVLNISHDVHRAQSSFRGEDSIDSLKKSFTFTAQENRRNFEIRLAPRSQTLRHRLNYLVVKLNKQNYLPRSLEVDGRNGVTSVFTFDINSVNTQLPKDTFEVLKTK